MREAIVTLSDSELEAIGFDGLVTLIREAGVRDVELLEDRGQTCVPQVEVDDRLDEDELEALDCVDRCEFLAETDDAYRYLLELTATGLPEEIDEDYEELLGTCEPSVTEQGLLLSLVGSQEAIREVLRGYEAAGVVPDLCRLGEYDGQGNTLDALTDRQFEVLRTAYEMGFYEVPRETTTEAIAGELGVDAATVSEHLQRAERNLLTRQLPA